MKHLKLLVMAIGLCAAFTSCSDDDKGNSVERTFSGNFLRITDNNSQSDAFLCTNADVRLFFNLDDGIADVSISNFQPTSSAGKGTLNMTGMPWAVDAAGAMVVNQPTVASNASVTKLKVEYLNRYVSSASGGYLSAPVLRVSFTYDNRYDVILYQEQYLYIDNATTVTTMEDGSVFSPKPNTQYLVTLNPTSMKASIHIGGAQFAEQMKPVKMVFKDIPFSFVVDGFVLQSESLVPESDGTPFPKFTITSLYGNAYLNGTLTLGFTCADKWRVNSTLKYLSPKPENKPK